MKWYFSKDGTQQGPIDEAELRARIRSGEIPATSLVWRDGMKDWQPVREVGELAPPVESSPYAPPASIEPAAADAGQPIPNYLWQSIAVTILCCWPLGIPAIVYSAKIDGLRARGEIAAAQDASNKAKMWCTIALVAGGLVIGLIVLSTVVGVYAGAN